MRKRRHRLVVDTNVWISFLLTNEQSPLDPLLFSKDVAILFSFELLEELIQVAKRPKFQKYFSPEDLRDLLDQIGEKAEFIDISTEVSICRDPKDNFLLALATSGSATVLLSGDKDLLTLKQFGRTKIMTVTQFASTAFA